MHILQVLPALEGGGVERGTIEIATTLAAQNIKTSVVSSGGQLENELTSLHVPHFTLPVQSKTPWRIITNGIRLAKLARENNISLIHARSRAPAWSCLIASKLTGIPYITTFHGVYGHQSRLKRWYNSSMLRGEYCIAVSDYVARHIEAIYPEHAHRTSLLRINRGVDSNYFDLGLCNAQKIKALRTQWRIQNHETVLLFPARYTRLKGHEMMLEALARLRDKSLRLVFVGNIQGRTHYVEELKALARNLKIEQRVVFARHTRSMREAYALSDLVVSANLKPESFGRTIAEAQAMQRRIIAPRLGAASSIVAQALGEGLFQAKSCASLAHAIEQSLLLAPEEVSRRTLKARQHVEQNFSLKTMCSLTLTLYRNIHEHSQ